MEHLDFAVARDQAAHRERDASRWRAVSRRRIGWRIHLLHASARLAVDNGTCSRCRGAGQLGFRLGDDRRALARDPAVASLMTDQCE